MYIFLVNYTVFLNHASVDICRLMLTLCQSEDNKGQADVASEFTPKQQRSIIHRIDRRLVTTLGVLYCASLMDRTNLSVANVAG